ncbi:hypothetical protein GH714_035250 [Hevea brasiliensis]|uniref:Dirigent protein n=1 Tax=Hevea brasiliensis TaxID=3981 RepID=A0A6A6L3M5_HEVBR|nr:hypothetical protein GH714_035250 [Hevea brasiliensis]
MNTHGFLSITNKVMASAYLLFLTFSIAIASSAPTLDEEPPVPVVPPQPFPTPLTPTQPNPSVAAASSGSIVNPDHALTFFMHDILGGSNPTARAVTGIVSNPAVNGQVPFAKPNGAVLPVDNGVPQNNNNNGLINNNNLPFLTGLSGTTANVLMFGTITVIDDELTESHDLRSGFVGRAQGFYVASSVDGTSQTMAFTTMFQNGHYEDSLTFFGVHRTAVSESQLAIMGGTGKYVNAKGFAIVKTFPATNQHETDGVETLLEFTVYVSY